VSDPAPPTGEGPPTIACPFCSAAVPDGHFCGACGAHLVGDGPSHARRLHSYAAFPDEPVIHLSAASTLFPHLSHRSRGPFRVALGVLMALIVVFSIAGTVAPLVAVCAFGVPLVFLIYVFEVDPYESSFVPPTAVALVLGGGLGTGWSLASGRLVNDALMPSVGNGVGSGRSLVAWILVPCVAELLMCLTIPLVRAFQRGRTESLDGFVVGASSALGFTLAATVVLLRPWLETGQLLHGPVLTVLTQGLIRGGAWPLVSALATGLVGAGYWATAGGRPTAAGGRWLASPVLALAAALVLQCGLALAGLAALPDAELLAAEAAVVVVLVVVTRIGLHHVLIHEAADATVGPLRRCGHCGRLVPAMAFCPECGVADRAITRRARRGIAPGPPARATADDAPAVAGRAGGIAPTRGHGHRHLAPATLLAILAAGVAMLTVAFVLVAVASRPAGPPHCGPLACKSPPIRPEIPTRQSAGATTSGRLYTSGSGFAVRVFPLANTSVYPGVSRTADSLTMTFPFTSAIGGESELTVVGRPDDGQTPQSIVNDEIDKLAPNASLSYVLPGAYVGYQPGYGEVVTTQVASSNGPSTTYELIVLAAVERGFAITVVAVGSRLADVGPRSALYDGHPSPASVNVAYVADQTVDSIEFPGRGGPA
jgi:RsiW-degrading membrane proteinase PrsW (M82 family)